MNIRFCLLKVFGHRHQVTTYVMGRAPFSVSCSHEAVFAKEIGEYFSSEESILDMTFGDGGHSKLLMDKVGANVIACDGDPMAISNNTILNFHPFLSKFSQLPQTFLNCKTSVLDGIIIDMGYSKLQLADSSRGFSGCGLLDLRMNASANIPTAAKVLQHIEEQPLLKLLRRYGGLKRYSRPVANVLIESRYLMQNFATVEQLISVLRPVSEILIASTTDDDEETQTLVCRRIVRKTLDALAAFVNDEMNELQFALRLSHYLLRVGGRLCVVTRNPQQAQIVKRFLWEVRWMGNDGGVISPQSVAKLMAKKPWETRILAEKPQPDDVSESVKLFGAVKVSNEYLCVI